MLRVRHVLQPPLRHRGRRHRRTASPEVGPHPGQQDVQPTDDLQTELQQRRGQRGAPLDEHAGGVHEAQHPDGSVPEERGQQHQADGEEPQRLPHRVHAEHLPTSEQRHRERVT